MSQILVVDDQLVIRNMFKNILTMEGYDVDVCQDGNEAFSAAKKKQYDLVITDLYMPECDGIQLTSKLRSLTNYTGIPILMVSTEGSDNKVDEGKQAGATGWLLKPVSKDTILPAIKKWLH